MMVQLYEEDIYMDSVMSDQILLENQNVATH